MGKKYSQEEIFEKLKTILVDDFEIAPEKLTLDANLFEDLELDSIDAVDLAVKLQEFTSLLPLHWNKSLQRDVGASLPPKV